MPFFRIMRVIVEKTNVKVGGGARRHEKQRLVARSDSTSST